jgi:hypothetical protein
MYGTVMVVIGILIWLARRFASQASQPGPPPAPRPPRQSSRSFSSEVGSAKKFAAEGFLSEVPRILAATQAGEIHWTRHSSQSLQLQALLGQFAGSEDDVLLHGEFGPEQLLLRGQPDGRNVKFAVLRGLSLSSGPVMSAMPPPPPPPEPSAPLYPPPPAASPLPPPPALGVMPPAFGTPPPAFGSLPPSAPAVLSAEPPPQPPVSAVPPAAPLELAGALQELFQLALRQADSSAS